MPKDDASMIDDPLLMNLDNGGVVALESGDVGDSISVLTFSG